MRSGRFAWYAVIGLMIILPLTSQAFAPRGEITSYYDDALFFQKNLNLSVDDVALWIAPQASAWTGAKSSGPDFSFMAAGPPFPITAIQGVPAVAATSEEGAVSAIQAFAKAKRADWPGLEYAEFTLLNVRRVGEIWHVALQQTAQGIPICGSRLDARITEAGYLTALSARLFPPDQLDLTFAIDDRTALRAITDDPSATIDFSRRVLYPVVVNSRVDLLPAWQVRAVTERADYRPAGIVNARTGQVLLQYNDVAFDEVYGNVAGLVLPHYWNDVPQAWEQKYQQVSITGQGTTYTDALGNYSLSVPSGQYQVQGRLYGYYVDVNVDGGEDATYLGTASSGQPHIWIWDYDLARQDEVNMYYHTTLVHDYFKELDPDFTALDYPLPATVSYGDNYENAFWNGSGIFFGEGGSMFRNFALFCDVIYHEYTHGVTDMIYPQGMLPYVGQSGAMDEAWSDYFACTITDEPLIGEGGLYTNGQVMRNLDNSMVYPDHWVGEVHADGQIIGGAFWDLRELVGAAIADSILHFAKYSLAETFEDYFLDVLIYDDDDGDLSNGGPHHPEIYEAFGLHGIGPGIEPVLGIFPTEVYEDGTGGSVGNSDGFFDPGEILSMTFSVSDFRYLYPPDAQDVIVTVSSDDPDLTFDPEIFSLGDIPPGGTVQAPESLMITVSPQADLAFSKIIFDISANGGSYSTSDEVEIIIGHPLTLLVDDDGGDDYEQFLDSSLRDWDLVFSTYSVADQGEITLDYLNEFQVVMWMTGDEGSNTLTADDQTNLSAFLNAGNDLLLTGQNLVEDIGSSDFFADYLGAAPLAGNVGEVVLDGVSGDPIADELWVMILGAGAGNNQTSPAAISALPGAVEIFHYRYDSQQRAGAVRYDAGNFKTVTFAFGIEAISGLGGSSSLREVLSSALSWFGLETAVETEIPHTLPREFSLGKPYPNPFNAQVTLPLQLPQNSNVRLDLYNLQGRLLETIFEGNLSAGVHAIRYDASRLSSGMYFVRVKMKSETGGQPYSSAEKIVLLK